MKIGIMSMQRIDNYGSFLQAYSLKKTIEAMGNTVEFVDYHVNSPIVPVRDVNSLHKLYRKARHLAGRAFRTVCNRKLLKRIDETQVYLEKLKEARKTYLQVTDARNYCADVDVLLIGSDEVFNCLQASVDVGYSLDLFGKDRKANRLISYAASFGNTTLERLNFYGVTGEIKRLLRGFDSISVRDKNSGQIVQALTGQAPLYHLDPVFLYNYTANINAAPKPTIDNYIIVYSYPNRINADEAAYIRRFADRLHKRLIAIGNDVRFCDIYIPASPFEVLGYFQHADYVITDTFHGTVFSIKYNKRFATIVRTSEGGSYGNSEKLTDLLERFGLTSRIVNTLDGLEPILNTPIDFSEANTRIQEETQRAKQYLQNNFI